MRLLALGNCLVISRITRSVMINGGYILAFCKQNPMEEWVLTLSSDGGMLGFLGGALYCYMPAGGTYMRC